MSMAVLVAPTPTRKERRVKRVEYIIGANYLLLLMGDKLNISS
jgi:hypothetical protein